MTDEKFNKLVIEVETKISGIIQELLETYEKDEELGEVAAAVSLGVSRAVAVYVTSNIQASMINKKQFLGTLFKKDYELTREAAFHVELLKEQISEGVGELLTKIKMDELMDEFGDKGGNA